MSSLITLLTDFGDQDVYVGVMKGVIATICPTARVIDLTHAIPPQDLYAARFSALNAYPYFPPGTIHLTVVDPGVGTARRAVAIQTPHSLLVGPDNGVFSGFLTTAAPITAVELTNPAYWRTPNPSFTFHGRDLFAPVAAHLAQGIPLTDLGQPVPIDSLAQLSLPALHWQAHQVVGTIQYIDHFGNGVTTIPAIAMADRNWRAEVANQQVPSAITYGDVAPGRPLSLSGSHGWIEIAVHQGSAQQQLGLRVGDRVVVKWED